MAKAIDREDSQSRVEVFEIPAAVDIASTDPFAALAAGGDGGKELLVATTLVTNLVSTLTSLLEKASGDASTAESHVVRALAAKVVDASGGAAGGRRMRTLLASSSFDLASEETVKSIADASVQNAVAAGATAPSSAATAAVAKLSSAAATVLKTDIAAASTPEAMMASAAAVSAVIQGSEVKQRSRTRGRRRRGVVECARHADPIGRRVDDELESRDGEADGVGRLAEGCRRRRRPRRRRRRSARRGFRWIDRRPTAATVMAVAVAWLML